MEKQSKKILLSVIGEKLKSIKDAQAHAVYGKDGKTALAARPCYRVEYTPEGVKLWILH